MLKKFWRSMFSRTEKKSGSILDQQMAEVAAFFSGTFQGSRDVLFAERLERSKLDLSLDSLSSVDNWLDVLYQAKVDPNSEEASESIIWAGAYVGEVIRANAKRSYTWMRYEDFMVTQPNNVRAMFPYSFGSQFLLVRGSGGMTLPINKVGRFLDEGPENNVHFYASAECSRSN